MDISEQPFPYSADTEGVRIDVRPEFLDDESDMRSRRFLWRYTVRIANLGDETVQLLSRYWMISDENGRTQTVSGEGVVGEQPTLAPGEAFTYVSGCPLATPSGMMFGHYVMEYRSGTRFEAKVPAFSLDSPHATKKRH